MAISSALLGQHQPSGRSSLTHQATASMTRRAACLDLECFQTHSETLIATATHCLTYLPIR